jgi:hypothetical protein
MVLQFKIGWKPKILVIFSCYHVHFFRFFFEHLKSHKKGGVEISKTEYAVFVYYKLESIYKTSSKFEEVMVQNQKKNVWSQMECVIKNPTVQGFLKNKQQKIQKKSNQLYKN